MASNVTDVASALTVNSTDEELSANANVGVLQLDTPLSSDGAAAAATCRPMMIDVGGLQRTGTAGVGAGVVGTGVGGDGVGAGARVVGAYVAPEGSGVGAGVGIAVVGGGVGGIVVVVGGAAVVSDDGRTTYQTVAVVQRLVKMSHVTLRDCD